MIRSASIHIEAPVSESETEKVVVECPYCGHRHEGEWLQKLYDECRQSVWHICEKCRKVFRAINYYRPGGC